MIFIYLFNLILDLLSQVFWLATGCLVRGEERSGGDRGTRGRGMGHYRGAEGEWCQGHVTRDHTHVQVHVARSLAVATGGGAVAVVTAAEVSTLTTLSSPSLQKVQALSRPILLQVNTGGSLFTVHLELGFESLWIFRVYIGVAGCCRVEN